VGVLRWLVWGWGDLAPRRSAVLAPGLVPVARRVGLGSAPVFAPLLWMARRLDTGLGEQESPPQATRPGAMSPREMALGVFSLAEMTTAEVMTPRIDIIAVDVAYDEARVIQTLRRSEHARLLVYDDSPDAVVGVLHAKDMLPRLGTSAPPSAPWQ